MPFEAKEGSETISVLVKLKGNPLNYVNSLQSKYYKKSNKILSKTDAVCLILNKIPKKIVEEAIKQIVADLKPRQ